MKITPVAVKKKNWYAASISFTLFQYTFATQTVLLLVTAVKEVVCSLVTNSGAIYIVQSVSQQPVLSHITMGFGNKIHSLLRKPIFVFTLDRI